MKRFGAKENGFPRLWWIHSISSYFQKFNNINIPSLRAKSFTPDPVFRCSWGEEWCCQHLVGNIMLATNLAVKSENMHWKKNNYFDHNVIFKVFTWKFAKSSRRPYSLLFMTMICDIKTKDPFSIISRWEHLKGWKIISCQFIFFFCCEIVLWKKIIWRSSGSGHSSPVCICSRKKIIARVNHNQLETFTEITEHLDLSFLELHAPRTSKWTIFGCMAVLDQKIIKMAPQDNKGYQRRYKLCMTKAIRSRRVKSCCQRVR